MNNFKNYKVINFVFCVLLISFSKADASFFSSEDSTSSPYKRLKQENSPVSSRDNIVGDCAIIDPYKDFKKAFASEALAEYALFCMENRISFNYSTLISEYRKKIGKFKGNIASDGYKQYLSEVISDYEEYLEKHYNVSRGLARRVLEEIEKTSLQIK